MPNYDVYRYRYWLDDEGQRPLKPWDFDPDEFAGHHEIDGKFVLDRPPRLAP